MIALTVALLAPGPRIDAAFETGQRRHGGEQRRLNGGRASVDHLFADRWRASLGYLGRRETVTEITLGDESSQTTKTEGPTLGAHQLGALVGFEHRWVHVAAGLGAEAYAGVDHQVGWHLRPAGRLRLGPRDVAFVDAAAFDPSPWSPGPGRARIGVGSRPGLSHLWAGWVATTDGWALGGAARIPIEGGLHLGVAAAIDPRAPGDHLVIQGGLGFTFGLEAPPSSLPAPKPGQPVRSPGLGPRRRDPNRPAGPTDPMGVPL